MLDLEVIQPSSSPWSSPVVLVRKPDGSFRFCVDYRALNAKTVPDTYPLPRVDDALDALQGNCYFTTIDCLAGFWGVPMEPASRALTAFSTPDGKYEFLRMPFGLINAPATFARMMDTVLGGLKWHSCLVYLDDVIIFGRTWEEHLQRLEAVFRAMDNADLTLKLSKCRFGFRSVEYLGHVISPAGIEPNPNKVQSILELLPPRTVKETQSFLGMANYYRKFIPHFSEKARPLHALSSSTVPFVWDDACQKSFDLLRDALASAPVLAYPDFTKRFEVHCDASKVGLGAVLMQEGRPIAYASWSLDQHQRNYGITELECLAVIWACEYFRPYVDGVEFDVYTDHSALRSLYSLDNPTGRLARWIFRLSLFSFTIHFRPGRLHPVPDALSRLGRMPAVKVVTASSASSDILSPKPPSSPPAVEVFLSSLSPSDRQQFPLLDTSVPLATRWSRTRAAQALLAADEYLIERVVAERVSAAGRPEYLVKWVDYPESDNTWQPSSAVPAILVAYFRACTADHSLAPALLDPLDDPDVATALNAPAVSAASSAPIPASWKPIFRRSISSDDTFGAIFRFLKKQQGLPSVSPASLTKRQFGLLAHLSLDDHLLWWHDAPHAHRDPSSARLVVPSELVSKVLEQYHEGPFGAHLGRTRLLSVIQPRFYWPRLHDDVANFVLACEPCQRRKSPRQRPAGLLSPSKTSLPWQVVFMDFLGPFPTSPSGNSYVVTAIDSLSKYAFAIAVPAANQEASLRMLRHLVTFGGVPRCLRTDQGSHFTGRAFEAFCQRLGLPHIPLAPYHHAAAGQVERLHSTLEAMIATSLGPNQDVSLFDELLDCFLFAYNSSVQASLGDTPFFLLFGRDPVLPPDLLLLDPTTPLDPPSATLPLQGYRSTALERRAAVLAAATDRLDGVRIQMQRRFDQAHQPSDFRVGDLVLLLHPSRAPGAKLTSPWCGPYRVLEVIGISVVRLSPFDNPLKKGVVHVSRIKHYYTHLHRSADS